MLTASGTGTPVFQIDNGGQLDNEGNGATLTDVVSARINMTSTGARSPITAPAADQSLVLPNSDTHNPGKANYEGTINERSSSGPLGLLTGSPSSSATTAAPAAAPTTGAGSSAAR